MNKNVSMFLSAKKLIKNIYMIAVLPSFKHPNGNLSVSTHFPGGLMAPLAAVRCFHLPDLS